MGEGHTEPTGGDRCDRQRLAVPEAAVLGVTVDAVRGRIRRGTLDSKREGGTVYVYVDTDPADRRDQAAEVEQYFKGAEYPTTKQELTILAREKNDAPEDFIRTLLGMSNLTFSGPEEVVEALERLRGPNWMMRD